MRCPRCNAEKNVRNGVLNGLQRYRCKACGFNYTVAQKSSAKSEEDKRQAIIMYLEGASFNVIARLLGVSHVSVRNWIIKYGNGLDEIRNRKKVSFMRAHDLSSYFAIKEDIPGFRVLLAESEDTIYVMSSEAEQGRLAKKRNDK